MKVERIRKIIVTLIIVACSLWTGTASGETNNYVFDPNQSTVVRFHFIGDIYTLTGGFQLNIDPNTGTASFDSVNATFSDDPNLQTGDLGELFYMSELVGDVNDTAIEFELPPGHPVHQSYDIQITLTFQNGQVRLSGQRSPLMVGEPGYTLEAVANDAPIYDLMVTVVSGHGTVEPISGSYYAGTLVTLTATPEAGSYVVRQWTGTNDDTSCTLTNTVTMDSNKTVTVEFGLPHLFKVPLEYPTIQEAIVAAACGDKVILSPGVYFEDINFNGKNITVMSHSPDDPMVVASTIIQGSGAGPVVTFSGSESQSCWLYGITITDGNTAGDGGGIRGNGTEATIANCVITNNHADGTGGGVSNCNGTLVGCTITDNTAHSGGGISGFNSPILIEDCRISHNSAIRYGGGVFLDGYAGLGFGGVPQVRQCLITENTAGENGGGMSTWVDHLVVTNCTFSGNYSQFGGGGMTNGGSNTTVSNCTFSDNSANAGGGGMCNYYSSPLVVDCIFRGNSANFGGGMENDSSRSSPTLTNCTFIGNTAIKDGGGMRNRYPNTPTLTNCLFSGNLADRNGGGIRNERSSSPTFTNCTFSGNSADNTGGGISNHHDSSPVLTNCILWGNDDSGGMGESAQIVGGKVVVTYSCIQGLDIFMGNNNIGDDPLFVDADGMDNVSGTEDDNLRLSFISPCIDAGDNTAVPPSVLTDLDGNPRIMGNAVDMGAYESRYYHVDGVNGDNTNDGFTRETAFETIQYAIDEANDCETVLVWPGVYNEAATHGINFKGKALTVKSASDAAVLEVPGFVAVSFVQGEDENSVFSNFVVRGSSTGIFALFANPTISNVTVVDNDNGVIADNANPEISNSIFWNNTNGDLFGSPDPLEARYSFVQDEIGAIPVAHWKFDEGSGTTAYDSAGTNDGTIYGAAWTTGQLGGALDFDGDGDYVEFASVAALQGDSLTAQAWIRVDESAGLWNPVIMQHDLNNNGYHFYVVNNSPSFYVVEGVNYAQAISPETINADQWYHVAGTNDGSNLKLYVDGQLKDSKASFGFTGVNYNAYIGFEPTSMFCYNGLIDDVRIYDRALSAEEIEAPYDTCLAGQEYGPLFADANSGDYHLKSEGWRWSHGSSGGWTWDDVTSPCIDAGNPGSPLGDEPMSVPRDPNNVWGINLRINMGAYGGTGQASMAPHGWVLLADLNDDGIVDFEDLAQQAQAWLIYGIEQPGDLNRDGVVNMMDFAKLAEEWLQKLGWWVE